MPIWTAEIKELELLYTSIKGQFPELEKELEQLIETKDANVVMLYSRRCLEVIITDLCECELKRPRKTEPLKGIIDKLFKEEKVPSHIITSMHGLNELSTYGAHPKDFDPEQVKPVLINLDIIIKWYLKYKNIITVYKTEIEEEKARLKEEPLEDVKKAERVEVLEKPANLSKRKLLSGIVALTILIIAAILAYPKIFKRDTLERLKSSGERISVAVMPFQNMTNDTIWNIWQDGIQNELITNLSNYSEELIVRQIESITGLLQSKGLTDYASITPVNASKISQKLDANVFIYGSIKQAGSKIRINAQLINSQTEEVYKSFPLDGTAENILHTIDSLSRMVKNFLIISKLEKEVTPDFKNLASTNSPEAYKYFISGKNAFLRRDYPTARNLLLQAANIDSNFILVIFQVAVAYGNQGMYEDAKKWCLKLYAKMDQMTMQYKTWTNWIYSYYFGTQYEAIKYLKQLLEFDDQSPLIYYNIGDAYNSLFQYDKAIPEFEKALEIYNKWDSKPLWVYSYTALGYAYHKTGQWKREKELYKKAEKDFPNDPDLIYMQAVMSLTEMDTITANRYIEKYKSILKDNSSSETDINTGLAYIYSEAGIIDKAEKYFRQALSLEPKYAWRLNNLSWFLIDKGRNINEGLELIERALQLSPENYYYLHTKGWGLYKQGKYKEAFDILQKSWDLRMQNAIYDHSAFIHLEEVKKAVASQKRTDR